MTKDLIRCVANGMPPDIALSEMIVEASYSDVIIDGKKCTHWHDLHVWIYDQIMTDPGGHGHVGRGHNGKGWSRYIALFTADNAKLTVPYEMHEEGDIDFSVNDIKVKLI